MTTPMIQRMAEAMAREDGWEWRSVPPFVRDFYLAQARAALEAMRSDGIGIGDYIWNKRIDAALTEDAADGEGE